MATPTLIAAGLTSAIAGLAFLAVALAVHRRGSPPEHRVGYVGHLTWWSALGAYLLIQGAWTVAAGLQPIDGGVYRLSRIASIPLLCASVWGISTYLTYLYTGRGLWATVYAVFYAAVAVLFFAATFATAPVLHTSAWVIGLDDDAAIYRVVYVFVGLPPIIASLAYLLLLRRLPDRAQRYRISLVGGGILAYVGSGLVARLAASDLVIFGTLVLLGLGAAAASLLAHYPPAGVRRWLEADGA